MTTYTWLATLFTMFVTFLFFYAASKINFGYYDELDPSATMVVVTALALGKSVALTSVPRVASAAIVLGFFVLLAGYSGSLVSFLAVDIKRAPLNSLLDIHKATAEVTFLSKHHSCFVKSIHSFM